MAKRIRNPKLVMLALLLHVIEFLQIGPKNAKETYLEKEDKIRDSYPRCSCYLSLAVWYLQVPVLRTQSNTESMQGEFVPRTAAQIELRV